MNENSYSIVGGKVLIIGDLHLSSVYSGSHIDYTAECYENMDNILSMVKEKKPTALILLGDVVGVSETFIRDRDFLRRVIVFFKVLNELTHGNVYSVKGNHDHGDSSDFDLLIGVGLLKNPIYLDFYGREDEERPQVRFHFVNYGYETRELDLVNHEDTSDVVLGHANYIIDGVTNWYQSHNGIDIKKLKNFKGVKLIIAGHIHIPSTEIVYDAIDGEEIGLLYTGSPSRVADRYDSCLYLEFDYQEESQAVEFEAKIFKLRPSAEVFYDKEEIKGDLAEVDEEAKRESQALSEIVKEIMEGRMTGGDLLKQVDLIPGASEKVRGIAKKYLQRAIDANQGG